MARGRKKENPGFIKSIEIIVTQPAVSIIVPSYNDEKHLRKRLDSIFNQTFRDFEVILLDDASTDGSRQIMEKYASRPEVTHFILNAENSGSTIQQWKKGIRLAEGEYIWIAESADFSDKRFLETLMDLFDRDKNVDLAFCASWYVDEKNTPVKPAPDPEDSFQISGEGAAQKYFSKYNLIRHAGGCVFNKKLIDPSFFEYAYYQHYGNWCFWATLSGRAWKIAYLNEKLNFSRNHQPDLFPETEKNGLAFSEGFQILDGLLKNEKITAFTKYQIYKFWGKKLHEAIFIRNEIDWVAKIRIFSQILFGRPRILRYALWDYKS